jgi:hypothetical protein
LLLLEQVILEPESRGTVMIDTVMITDQSLSSTFRAQLRPLGRGDQQSSADLPVESRARDDHEPASVVTGLRPT